MNPVIVISGTDETELNLFIEQLSDDRHAVALGDIHPNTPKPAGKVSQHPGYQTGCRRIAGTDLKDYVFHAEKAADCRS